MLSSSRGSWFMGLEARSRYELMAKTAHVDVRVMTRITAVLCLVSRA